MKTALLKISLALFVLFAFNACNLKDAIEIPVSINDQTINFDILPSGSAGVSQANKVAAEAQGAVILWDGTINVNVAKELEKNGYSFNMVKSFLLTQAELTVTVPAGVTDVSAFLSDNFKNLKLYFDDQTQLVAQFDSYSATAKTISIKIVNGELLNKLKNDQLHIILTGDKRPTQKISCKLTTSYLVKIKPLK